GNKFLANIREVDAIVHVVRCFEDGDIVHVDGGVDPVRDVETINLELIFSDLEIVERRIERATKLARADKTVAREVAVLERLRAVLEDGQCARTLVLDEEEESLIAETRLLTRKPVIYVANIGEDEVDGGYTENPAYCALAAAADAEHAGIIAVCAQIEAELSDMTGEDKEAFLADLGIEESGLDKLIRAGYALLGLISYLTAGPKEVRAWTIKEGTKAPGAAGKIHSDFERGFIRAEVVAYEDFVREGSINAAREKGLYRSEGKEYVIRDGDIVLFSFIV
ncbi:MAG: redox-regulated ATPase YchF, partial [Clostridia bacterium]|nr:redox-regulated ATPase YchF [Clostridia bacterium]